MRELPVGTANRRPPRRAATRPRERVAAGVQQAQMQTHRTCTSTPVVKAHRDRSVSHADTLRATPSIVASLLAIGVRCD